MNNQFYNYKKDGITQGALAKFMSCRQEANLFFQGWSYKGGNTSPALMYGTLIHGILERVYEDIRTKKLTALPNVKGIAKYVNLVQTLYKRENPSLSNESLKILETSLCVAEATLPAYFKRWWKHDYNTIKWERLEQKFSIPYKTKDGRNTFIKGKKDGVFSNPRLWLFETKSKSMINEGNLIDTLSFELQVNLYLWAMKKTYKKFPAGVLYNIIRKPGLERKKTESLFQYGERISEDINKRSDFYFIRYEIMITPQEILAFEKELEGLIVDFMDWCEGKVPTYKNTAQCITKYGRCPMLSICSDKCYVQFEKRKAVYRELEGCL